MKRIVAVAAFLLLTAVAQAEFRAGDLLGGRVVAISDGDTLTLLTTDKQQAKIRLAEIDAPESRQPFGTRAKQMLSDLVFGKEADVLIDDIDRYGRLVGRIYVGKVDVNAEMVKQGGVWVYRQYSRDPLLLVLEQEAKRSKRGLWALPESERMPPWDWRRAARDQASAAETQKPSSSLPSSSREATSSGSCGNKRTCKQMSDCTEARHYLTACGVKSLDGDGDGVPCEALCR